MVRKIKGLLITGLALLIVIMMSSCSFLLEESFIPLPDDAEVPLNPNPEDMGPVPPATVLLEGIPSIRKIAPSLTLATSLTVTGSSESGGDPSLIPDELTATLSAGESIEEENMGYIPGAPPKGDIVFTIDLTGSMNEELSNVKNNSINIMNAVRGIISDTNFGVISHMDYGGSHSGYGYSATYGSASGRDYPYSLDQSLTDDLSYVQTAITGLSLGYGDDMPESYTRVLYESYTDSNIAWRKGAKRILLCWQDSIPHDRDPFLDLSQPSSGPDPGRDEVDLNSDDLDLKMVLEEMNNNNITLIALNSAGSSKWPNTSSGRLVFDYWEKYANMTGGTAYKINTNGTVPEGVDIATFVAGIIKSEISHIDKLTLKAPGYEAWLVFVDPPEYTNVDINNPKSFSFDIRIQVPDGTAPGEYDFEIILDGDGVNNAKQVVSITVPDLNRPPVADAGMDQTVEQTSLEGALVTLDGSGSSDPDGNELTYNWSWLGGIASGVNPIIFLPYGSTIVTLSVDDGNGGQDTDTVEIIVQDTEAPVIDFEMITHTIWPPNHMLVKVAVVNVSDICDTNPTVSISITHNENPHNKTIVGDGNIEPDWEIDSDGNVWVRAERNGTGEGRVYTITVSASDDSDNISSSIVKTVYVSHDRGKSNY
jgi:hypothetical protein